MKFSQKAGLRERERERGVGEVVGKCSRMGRMGSLKQRKRAKPGKRDTEIGYNSNTSIFQTRNHMIKKYINGYDL